MNIGTPELVILFVLVMVLFGGAQIPKLARNVGRAHKEFKTAAAELKGEAVEAGSRNEAAAPTHAVDAQKPAQLDVAAAAPEPKRYQRTMPKAARFERGAGDDRARDWENTAG